MFGARVTMCAGTGWSATGRGSMRCRSRQQAAAKSAARRRGPARGRPRKEGQPVRRGRASHNSRSRPDVCCRRGRSARPGALESASNAHKACCAEARQEIPVTDDRDLCRSTGKLLAGPVGTGSLRRLRVFRQLLSLRSQLRGRRTARGSGQQDEAHEWATGSVLYVARWDGVNASIVRRAPESARFVRNLDQFVWPSPEGGLYYSFVLLDSRKQAPSRPSWTARGRPAQHET